MIRDKDGKNLKSTGEYKDGGGMAGEGARDSTGYCIFFIQIAS